MWTRKQYRTNLSPGISGTDTSTLKIYGPFEAGFTSSNPGTSCLGSQSIKGGIDTYTAELMIKNICKRDNISLLGTCGDHVNPRHFHEYGGRRTTYTKCLTTQDSGSGHSTRIGTMGDGRGVYGAFESHSNVPELDVCGAHIGVTPDSNGEPIVHYHYQGNPPFFGGCYTNYYANITVQECRNMYPSTCFSAPENITTDDGTDAYQLDCPCFDLNTRSNVAGATQKPLYWPSSFLYNYPPTSSQMSN